MYQTIYVLNIFLEITLNISGPKFHNIVQCLTINHTHLLVS